MAKKFMYVCLGMLALAVAFHLGARSGQTQPAAPDIAIGTGMIGHDVQIPLPYYSDGTQASEDECIWLVAPRWMPSGRNSILGFTCKAESDRIVYFKQVTLNGTFYDCAAQYLIIALRGGGATATQPTTWSQIKAEFGE